MARRLFFAALLLATACVHQQRDPANDLIEDGRLLYKRGSYAEAREHFAQAIKLRPEDADLYFNVGRCDEGRRKPVEAEAAYRECLKRKADHEPARHRLVALMVEGKREDEAKAEVARWLEDAPTKAAPYVEDGWFLMRAGAWDDAIWRYQQALERDPTNARALRELGIAYESTGRKGRALILYQQSLASEPAQPELRKKVDDWRKEGVPPPRPD